MIIKAQIALSREVLESLTEEDLRFIEAEVSRRMEEKLTTLPGIDNSPKTNRS